MNKKEQKLTELLKQKITEVFLMGECLNNNPELFKEEDFKEYTALLKTLEYLELISITLNDKNQSIKLKAIFF